MLMRPIGGDVPFLQTDLPGPKAAEMVTRDERVTSPSYTRSYPLAVARGSGMTIEDVDGNRFLDFTAGIAVCSTGHCHPRVVAAIREQAEQLLHMSGTDFYYGPQARLAEKLAAIAPGSEAKRVFFTNSGAESVEAALKLARYHTKRQNIIAFLGAFHGRTMGAMSVTASKVTQRAGFYPLLPGVHHVHYPHCSSCPQRREEVCCDRGLAEIEELFARTLAPESVAAIIVEPIQGEGGYIVPPEHFHVRLKELAEKHGILYIADEVQAGMGRTGTMFAVEHWGIEPDIICLAKGLASGMPLGAIVAREDVMDWPPGSHASTFGGNPVCCAAALETIALLEEELIENAATRGEELLGALRQLAAHQPRLGEVRGKGLMVGVDVVSGAASREPDAAARDRIVDICFHKGLLLLGCGTHAIRFCPPLVVNSAEIQRAVEILAEALTELESGS